MPIHNAIATAKRKKTKMPPRAGNQSSPMPEIRLGADSAVGGSIVAHFADRELDAAGRRHDDDVEAEGRGVAGFGRRFTQKG